jgi:phosphinothricin acetyltransferase
MNIRLVEKEDATQITGIFNDAIAEGGANAFTEKVDITHFDNKIEQSIQTPYKMIVAHIDSIITGFAYLSPYRKERKALSDSAEISFYIHRKYRNRGIASRLITGLEQVAFENSIISIFAIILESNTSSIRLVEKQSYEKWAFLPKVCITQEGRIGQFYYGKVLE